VRDLYDPGQGSKEFHYAPKLQGKSEKGVTKDDVYEQQSGENSKEVAAEEKLQELKTEIEKAIEEKRGSPSSEGVLGDIEIKVDQRGLVIEIMDTEKSSMFASGQAVINNKAQSKLVEIGKILSKVSNPIDIEGHTDGNPFKSSRSRQYDNWNLSTDRANTARRVLESTGFEKGQIARVVGYADARPKDTSNPLNPANRRITISMRYSGRAKVELDGKQVYETSTNKPKVLIPPSKKDIQKPVDATVSPNDAGNALVDPVEQGANAQDVNKLTEMDQGLNVEVSTVVPEGAQVVQEEQGYVADQEKKTLIFENPDAFFKK